MNIDEIMTAKPACCLPETKLEDVARMMVQKNCGAIPVVDDLQTLKPVGILTDRDIYLPDTSEWKEPTWPYSKRRYDKTPVDHAA